MAAPDIKGLNIVGLIGEGACGSIYLARSADGNPEGGWLAVREFNTLAVNLPLIEGMMGRLKGSSYPSGLIPLSWKKSQQDKLCMVMPLLADMAETGTTRNPQIQAGSVIPRTLQRHTETYKNKGVDAIPADQVWATLEKIGQAIARMHQHHIPHGNLKPGNIFFDEKGDVQLTDFAMGQMPGVSIPPFSDALLYAPPEQLSDPKGYLSGKGYAWDSYAFGFLAFQLLTGKIPLCESTHHRITPAGHERQVSPPQADVIRLSLDHEQLKLAGWPEQADDPLERKRRQIIARCLELNPDDRYVDLNEVLHAWHDIETETEVLEAQSELRQQSKSNKLTVIVAAAALIGCAVLAITSNHDSSKNAIERAKLHAEIADQVSLKEQAAAQAKTSKIEAQKVQATALAAQKIAETREKKHREQLISLGVANDHLLAWMMRDHSKDLPELQKSGNARDTLVAELQQFLKLTEENDQFQPVRARIMMQLAELEIHNQNPSAADQLLDAAVAAWAEAKLEEPGHAYRIARARLACLMLALDQKKKALAKKLLPKARHAAQSNSSHDTLENQRLKAVMLIIDGRMIESSDPAKALTYFQQAITAMKGLRRTLTENVIVRSDLSRYTLEAATLADSLNRVEDADRLRGEAASYLEALLKKAPHLELPKVQLAKIHIMAANAAIREGNDSAGEKQLAQAEQLLSKLGTGDTSPEGASMQMAAAKGLRAVLLRDAGKTTEAQQKLKEAIQLTETIVAAQKGNTSIANEPLYRLAVLHWQLAGLIGDRGDSAAELLQGKKAAGLMEDLLQKDAGEHDNAIRRGLGYLYGDLGHTAAQQGDKKEAAAYFNHAAIIWKSLITKYGKEEEYTDGLKWSQSRQREMSGEGN